MRKNIPFTYKIVLLLICNLQLAVCNLQAQNNTLDSLNNLLKTAIHDTTRCNILYQLIETVSDDDNIWSKHNEELLKIAEKGVISSTKNAQLKSVYLKYLAEALNNNGYIFELQSNFAKALEYYFKSLKIREEISNKEAIANSLNNIGVVYNNLGDVAKVLEYFNKSLKIREEINDKKGIANSLNNIGSVYDNQGDIPKALEYYHKSLKIREEINDKERISMSLNNIAIIYFDQGDFTRALDFYNKSLKIQEEIKDKDGIARSLNNIGSVYKSQGKTTKALEYFYKSLAIRQELNDKKGIANSFVSIASIYSNQNNNAKALEYYQKSLKIREEINHKEGIANSLFSIGVVLLKQNEYAQAFKYAERSLKLAKELGYPAKIKNSASLLKEIYQKQNKYKLAFEMYELEIQMRDSIINQETKKATIKKQMQYEYEKKFAADSVANVKQHEIKNIEIKKQQAEIKAKRNQQYALYGGLVMVIIFAIFMYNRFRVTNKQKQIIELKEKETQQQKHIIEEKHKEITDSINYAERIQRSFLATKELLDENLNDYFVLFQPKDVVSGDFYWAAEIQDSKFKVQDASQNNKLFCLATADSTGHGVPGAIMSLLNITSLESAIKEGYTEPAEILNATRKTIIERLKKDGSAEGGKDGMDCSLTVYDFNNKKLFVTAANNPVWIVRGTEVIEIKPDKMPVGKHDKQDVLFTQHEIDLQNGDVVYTLTDGFPDQFGGESGKKFMSKKLRELLLANANLPMQEQKELLQTTFKNWVGELEQVDDVCVIGVRV